MAKMFFTKHKISVKQNQKHSKYYYIGLTNVWITLEPVIAAWISCDNHKVALYFKHLLDKFPSVADADAKLFALWKFLHYKHLAVNFLENTSEIYGEPSIVPVCSSVTRWTAHDRACKNLYNGYEQFLRALTVCLNERKEPEALGLFTEIKDEEFTTSILMLRDIFDAVHPLNLVIQKGDGLLYLSIFQCI